MTSLLTTSARALASARSNRAAAVLGIVSLTAAACASGATAPSEDASAGGGSPGSGGGSSAVGTTHATGTGAGTATSSGGMVDLGPAPTFDEAVGPALKIDFDVSGRPSTEVTELGYNAWPIEAAREIEKTFDGVTFRLESSKPAGTELKGTWVKGLVQAPTYARLVGDGVTVDGGDSGAEVRLTLENLAPGAHSLLAFLNELGDAATDAYAPIDIEVNGSPAASGIVPTGRAASAYAARTAYVRFEVASGEDIVIVFRADTSSKAPKKNVLINGIELDTPDAIEQAKNPSPAYGDEHVDGDSGSVTLSWEASDLAATHDVYVGEDREAVEAADRSSPLFRGNQTSTSWTLTGVSSLKTYYWRVDEIDAQNHGTKGDVWYFRPRQLAFPAAEGHGRFARGGRGGVVVHVTNLDDAGPGSLREAIENDIGPRTIVFDVGGIIKLSSRLVLNDRYVTVAGQTAPGKGIVIRAAPFGMSGAQDVIIRHVRVRLGAGTTFDGMGMTGSDHAIIDHASISWTIDEAFSSRGGKNITLQRTLISEALNVAGHQNYPDGTAHGYAATIGGDVGSFHHNLLAHCEGRNWSMGGGLDGYGVAAGRLDIFNNVVYNWGGRTTDGGAHEVNFVGNYYKPGAASKIFVALSADYEAANPQQYFIKGNVMPGHFSESNQADGRQQRGTPVGGYSPWVDAPFFPSHATIEPAGDAYKSVLSDVGCTSPVLDDHDVRVIKETLNGTTTYKGSRSGKPGLPDHENDVGGYESYPNAKRAADWDSDGDGLPDWWEGERGLNTSSPAGDFSDGNRNEDGDGYTELEDYLEWMANAHHSTSKGQDVTIDLGKAFVGYTQSPTYMVSGPGQSAVKISGKSAVFSADSCGLVTFVLHVKDSSGAGMSKPVGVHVACD
ncbi:hypothetical protein WME79_27340 [Sorangium sp. So ce726]|uniref:T9SS C-terminal target domain-containing protein n=1 Tax=Sorangium sp. So ce726 TaxID=3133319 RepID=UPI003F5F794D